MKHSFSLRLRALAVKKTNRMNKLFIIFILVCLIPLSGISQKNCWPSYRGNPELNGNVNAEIPDALKLLWSFTTDDIIKGLNIQLAGQNILNEKYFDPGVRTAIDPYAPMIPQFGRTFMIKLTYQL